MTRQLFLTTRYIATPTGVAEVQQSRPLAPTIWKAIG